MPDETTSGSSADAHANALHKLSIRTKALVIASEYTHRQMGPSELAQVLAALAPTAKERALIARAVEGELRAARCTLGEITRLTGELLSGDGGAPAGGEESPPLEPHPTVAPASEEVVATQELRVPHLMPFEHYEFQVPESTRMREGSDVTAPEEAPPTRRMSIAEDVNPGASPTSWAGGRAKEPGRATPRPPGFSIDKFSKLGKPEAGGPKPVVLVADDDARARVMYRMKLEQTGFAVREAKDGLDAWAQIENGGIEVLVTDMKMPGCHGMELLGRMMDTGRTIPVVVVSAFDQLQNEFVISTYPKLMFLAKPASPDSVAAAVGAFAREARKRDG